MTKQTSETLTLAEYLRSIIRRRDELDNEPNTRANIAENTRENTERIDGPENALGELVEPVDGIERRTD